MLTFRTCLLFLKINTCNSLMLKKIFSWMKKPGSSGRSQPVSLAIDPELNYCPGCGDEYRANIQKCASCEINLISGKEKLEKVRLEELSLNRRSMNITAQDQRVVIRNGKLRDLKPLRGLLAKERIPTIISGEPSGCAKG